MTMMDATSQLQRVTFRTCNCIQQRVHVRKKNTNTPPTEPKITIPSKRVVNPSHFSCHHCSALCQQQQQRRWQKSGASRHLTIQRQKSAAQKNNQATECCKYRGVILVTTYLHDALLLCSYRDAVRYTTNEAAAVCKQ